jgi:hypothetical protein
MDVPPRIWFATSQPDDRQTTAAIDERGGNERLSVRSLYLVRVHRQYFLFYFKLFLPVSGGGPPRKQRRTGNKSKQTIMIDLF